MSNADNQQIAFFTGTFIPMVKRACRETGETYTSNKAIKIWNQLAEISWLTTADITQQTVTNRLKQISRQRTINNIRAKVAKGGHRI